MTSAASDPEDKGTVRNREKSFSGSEITETVGSPGGSDSGAEDTGPDAGPLSVDQQDVDRLLGALGHIDLGGVEYPSELEF